jgi:DNA-directed RNA polymerase specialized sigma24 family protein
MTGDITQWLGRLARGDQSAAQAVWERYFEKLVRLARRHLGNAPRTLADEEDVALSAMRSFYRGMAAGRYPRLNDQHDLWKVLVTITAHKALAQLRRERAQKRGRGLFRQEADFCAGRSAAVPHGVGEIVGDEPTPAFAALVAEEYRRLLTRLDDKTLVSIAVWKMEGYTSAEIARELGCTERTVQRKLRLIRAQWGGRDAR